MPLNSRTALLALAENETVKDLLLRNGMSKGFVRRFVAGETLTEAMDTARVLQGKHIHAALDLLGENVQTAAEAGEATDAYIQIFDAIAQAGMPDAYISIKLTALGLDLGETVAARYLDQILRAAQAYGNVFVRVDMEGSAYTQRTLDIIRSAHQRYGNIGTVLQSYLYRTDDDVQLLIAEGIPVRLVKGAYAEPPSVAFPHKVDVDAAYVRQMGQLLLHGCRPAIATHDEAILREAKRFVREHRVGNDGFEFQLLLGVRRDLQEGLVQEGYHVRAYVPFGRTWYPYFMRRLAERPANIGFILKSLVRP